MNDGNYTDECLKIPIVDRRGNQEKVVGFVSSVSKDSVTGIIYDGCVQKEILENGLIGSVEISI